MVYTTDLFYTATERKTPWWIKVRFIFCREKRYKEGNVTMTFKKFKGHTLITGCYSNHGPFIIGPLNPKQKGGDEV